MFSRSGGAALVLVCALAIPSASRAAQALPGSRTTPVPAAHPAPAPSTPLMGHGDGPTQPQVSQDAAARARMHECAHQWSSIKKAGNAGATTWKEFSATCLVVSR